MAASNYREGLVSSGSGETSLAEAFLRISQKHTEGEPDDPEQFLGHAEHFLDVRSLCPFKPEPSPMAPLAKSPVAQVCKFAAEALAEANIVDALTHKDTALAQLKVRARSKWLSLRFNCPYSPFRPFGRICFPHAAGEVRCRDAPFGQGRRTQTRVDALCDEATKNGCR